MFYLYDFSKGLFKLKEDDWWGVGISFTYKENHTSRSYNYDGVYPRPSPEGYES